ncbi:MAG: hypothetical protein ACREJC_23280 [Tepidisphaeraceae bacterium]
MTHRGDHCPFLNRANQRCAEHFSLDRLGHAFEYCFNTYAACPVYQELLEERQARRGQISQVSDGASRLVQVTISASAAIAARRSGPAASAA